MKGMRKIQRGRGFRGALNYALERDDEHTEPGRLIGGNMSGTNPASLGAEFKIAHTTRPDIEKPVWHQALRLPEGERLADAQWSALLDDYMGRMGFSDSHMRVYVMHDDLAGQHVHIVASRVGIDAILYLGKNENLRSTTIVRDLEKDYGLRVTLEQAQERTMPKKGELEQALRTGEKPVRMRLAEMIDANTADRPSLVALANRLTAQGVSVQIAQANTGKVSGLSFELEGIALKASQLGKAYAFQQLQKRMDYEQDRDRKPIAEWRNRNSGCDAQSGVDNSDRHDATESNAGRDGIERAASGRSIGGASRSGHDRDKPDREFDETGRRCRPGVSPGSRRAIERVSGSGATASAAIRAQLAEKRVADSRRRPIFHGAYSRVLHLAATGRTAADDRQRSTSPRHNSGVAAYAPSRTAISISKREIER